MNLFKNIDYKHLTYEALRDYFSVNKAFKLSYLYKFLLACVWPLKASWDAFETYRAKVWMISQCKWQIGQLQNVLNYLYDPVNNSIYITQSAVNYLYANTFADSPPICFANTFADTPIVFAPTFDDMASLHPSTIFVPASIFGSGTIMSDFIATCEKIKPIGIVYQIKQIP